MLYHCHISTLVALFVQEPLILSAARESLSYSFVTRHNNQALFDVKSENNYSVLSAHRWQLGITWCTKTDGIYQSKGSVHLSQHFHFMTLRWKLRDQKHLVWWGHGLQWAVFLFLLFWDCNINVVIPPPYSQCGINLSTWKRIPPILIIFLVFESIYIPLIPQLSPGFYPYLPLKIG